MRLRPHTYRLLACVPLALSLSVTACSSGGGGSSSNGGSGVVDTTTPTVSSTSPTDGAVGTPRNAKIAATFSESMSASSINTSSFTLEQGVTPVAGTVVYTDAGRTAVFSPTATLAATTNYTATITTGAMDPSGNALASNFIWSFTTGATSDTTPPSVTSTRPASAATGVFVNSSVNATFSKAIDPSTLTTSTFTLMGAGPGNVAGGISYDATNHIATLRPSSNLSSNTLFNVTVTAGVKDLAGNALASNFTWSFTTGAAANQAPGGVNLGSAAGFVALAGSTVTNVNNPGTTLTGNLGVSPGSGVTGFPPGVINGTKHVDDPAAAQAKLDLTTAYNDAAGRSTAPITVAGNLGGMTLAPGLYKSTSGLEISSGDLTLDGQGDANGVFIFQMAQTLITTAGRKVILIGGANAANVYWQVGTSATIGTNSAFQGTILADQSIALSTGASLQGRALTRIGAVTLDTNVVTIPAQ